MADSLLGEFEEETPSDDFAKATEYVRGCPGAFSDSDLLFFYARYKQASKGPCSTSKPGIFNLTARKKWEAWNSLGDLSSEVAKRQYVEKLSSLKADWLPKDKSVPVKKFGQGMQIKVSKFAVTEDDIQPMTASEFVKCENIELLRHCLLQNPSVVNIPDESDEEKLAPLHWACDRGNLEIVSLLLQTPGVDVNIRDSSGQTPLHYAASCDHLECVKLLLQNENIRPTLKDDDGMTAADTSSNDAIKTAFQSYLS